MIVLSSLRAAPVLDMGANITDTHMEQGRAVAGGGTLDTMGAQLTWDGMIHIMTLGYYFLTQSYKRIAVPLPRHPPRSAVAVVTLVRAEYVHVSCYSC